MLTTTKGFEFAEVKSLYPETAYDLIKIFENKSNLRAALIRKLEKLFNRKDPKAAMNSLEGTVELLKEEAERLKREVSDEVKCCLCSKCVGK